LQDLRQYLRAAKDYRVQYGPFPLVGRDDELKESRLRNISGGGLLFEAHEPLPEGRQVVLKIFLPGWRAEGLEISPGQAEDEATLSAVAEVVRCQADAETDRYIVGVKFLGRII
jgi:c-di-GMP-binding flagellar brake protein YcgR